MAGTRRPSNDLLVRSAALGCAVLLHVPVLFITASRQGPQRQSSALVLVDVKPDRPNASTPAELPAARPTPQRESPDAPALDDSRERTPPIHIELPPPVDWRSSGAIAGQAAVDALIRQEGYRPLGPRKAPQFVEPEGPPSIFEKPKHQYGDITEGDAPGRAKVWHSENCYTELDKPVSARPTDATIGNVNIPKCVGSIGRKKPRGDLFEHLKRKREE